MPAVKEPQSALELKLAKQPKGGKPPRPYAERAYVCSITDIPWTPLDFDYGRYIMQPREKGEEYRVTTITAAISRMDHGDNNTSEHPISALDIADDICRMLNANAGEGGYVGVFVCEHGPKPTEEELIEAHEKLSTFCEHFVAVADEDFQRFQSNAMIPGFARFAATYLNLQKPYLTKIEQMLDCPNCAEPIRQHAVTCRHCGFVVNAKRHAELHPVAKQATQQPRA